MIILVDVDSTVLDLMPEWLRRYNNDFSDHVTVDQITEWDMAKFVHPDCGTKIYSYLLMDDLYENVKPIDGAMETLSHLENQGHRIVFVSSGVYSYPKFCRLEQLGFNVGKYGSNYVVCHDKSLIRGDLLIDDGEHNITAFHNFDSILFDQPWNRNFSWHYRANSWADVLPILERQSNY